MLTDLMCEEVEDKGNFDKTHVQYINTLTAVDNGRDDRRDPSHQVSQRQGPTSQAELPARTCL